MLRPGVPSAFLGALWIRPWAVPASRAAETPRAAPTEMSPFSVRRVTVPRTAPAVAMEWR
ncbi:hypothetical protein AVL59_01365 [Streptomyces griseochromogenes]|uniref:Uncharacterized protein n=1 Tax=Streptomyces griseochromogenes TaxID=68214 RepID=A0A1B1APD9_9ACTN|nr:hypothetical protein AVL59_01365 [Streptomyces griseochromogenes]